MSFSFWSLDFIYYPVSGIMWIWHKIFGVMLGYSSPWTWVLSVLFLVFTLRAILFKPFMKQMESSLKMQELRPQMQKIKEKYKNDRQRQTEELTKLNKEAGVNPLASCLPALLQLPAFIGLFHVLRNFVTAYGSGGSDIVNNYFFGTADVDSFHDALLFHGASLSGQLFHFSFAGGSISITKFDLADIGANFHTQLAVALPLMIIASVTTHFSSRKSVARQAQMGQTASSGAMAMMPKLMMWVFPLAVLVIGWAYPLALLFYWLANNTWTLGQLAVAHRIQDRKLAEEAKIVEAEKEAKGYSKPQPGAKPKPGAKPRTGSKPQIGGKPQPGAKPQAGGKPGAGTKPQPGAKPRPGAKPQQRAGQQRTTNGGQKTSGQGQKQRPTVRPDSRNAAGDDANHSAGKSNAGRGASGSGKSGSGSNGARKKRPASGSQQRPASGSGTRATNGRASTNGASNGRAAKSGSAGTASRGTGPQGKGTSKSGSQDGSEPSGAAAGKGSNPKKTSRQR